MVWLQNPVISLFCVKVKMDVHFLLLLLCSKSSYKKEEKIPLASTFFQLKQQVRGSPDFWALQSSAERES